MTQELYTQPNCPSSLNEKRDVIKNTKTQNKEPVIKIEKKTKQNRKRSMLLCQNSASQKIDERNTSGMEIL